MGREILVPMDILRRDANYVIGIVEIRIEGHKADLGNVIARPEWNKGFATEAVQSVVNWAIEQPRIMRVWPLCDIDNDALAWVLEKFRMKGEGVHRRFIVHPTVSKNLGTFSASHSSIEKSQLCNNTLE